VAIDYTKHGARMPPKADRSEARPDELAAYDHAVAQSQSFQDRIGSKRPPIDGAPYQLGYYDAWTNAPHLFATFWALGRAVQSGKEQPGSYRMDDHEMIDMILSLDAGYGSFFPAHTPTALSAGIRLEALEALAHGREEELTDDERLQVQFIRAVRDLELTDELWDAMVERLGSVRGAIYFAFFTCYLAFTQQMMAAFGSPGLSLEGWQELLQQFRDGLDPVPLTHDYIWQYKPKPGSDQTAD
jgi:hypothetical protein